MNEDQKATSSSKGPVKVRLARKWVDQNFSENLSPMPPLVSSLQAAYLAGFERARALCIDHAMRSLDERIEYSTLGVPYLEVSGGLKPSEVLGIIGE